MNPPRIGPPDPSTRRMRAAVLTALYMHDQQGKGTQILILHDFVRAKATLDNWPLAEQSFGLHAILSQLHALAREGLAERLLARPNGPRRWRLTPSGKAQAEPIPW